MQYILIYFCATGLRTISCDSVSKSALMRTANDTTSIAHDCCNWVSTSTLQARCRWREMHLQCQGSKAIHPQPVTSAWRICAYFRYSIMLLDMSATITLPTYCEPMISSVSSCSRCTRSSVSSSTSLSVPSHFVCFVFAGGNEVPFARRERLTSSRLMKSKKKKGHPIAPVLRNLQKKWTPNTRLGTEASVKIGLWNISTTAFRSSLREGYLARDTPASCR